MHSGIWFILVGVSAGLTHLSIYYIATQGIGILNEWANACGFVIAFFVSFAGHRYLSFKDSGTTIKQSLLRFNDWIALFIAIAGAAAQTFLLSRFWAFKKKNSA